MNLSEIKKLKEIRISYSSTHSDSLNSDFLGGSLVKCEEHSAGGLYSRCDPEKWHFQFIVDQLRCDATCLWIIA
jgi:hypothetical protein